MRRWPAQWAAHERHGIPDLQRAREEASEWVARLDRGLTADEQAQLRAWRQASPANARALKQLSQLWGGMGVMKALATMFPEPVQAQAPARDGTPGPARRTTAIAAGLVLAVALAGSASWYLLRSGESTAAGARAAATTYETAVGEQRTIPLQDGSSLAINTASLVEVQSFDQSGRELRLVRGEALFTVAHDATRPFRVRVGERTVEAVGTAFDIRLHTDGAMDVLVTDGRVRLLPAAGTSTSELQRGQSIRIDSDGSTRIAALDEQALATRLAWRQGMIVFEGQPLAAALEEFSRYTPVRLVVADEATGQRPVGGTIPAGDVTSLLEALRISLGLTSVRAADGSIRIGPQR